MKKTISEVIDNMPLASMLTKYRKRVLPIEDVLEEAKRHGIKKPRVALKSEVMAGLIKLVGKRYIEVPEYKLYRPKR